MEPTKKYVAKCHSCGGEWLSYNTFTERYDLFYVRKGTDQTMSQTWDMKTKSSGAPSTTQPLPPDQPKAAAKAIEQTPDKPKGKAKCMSSSKRKREEVESVQSDEEKARSLRSITAATKTTANYMKATTAAENLLQQIKTAPDWSWANNSHILTAIINASEFLAGRLDSSAREILSRDIVEMKKTTAMHELGNRCAKFSMDLDPGVDTLTREHARLLRQYAARAD